MSSCPPKNVAELIRRSESLVYEVGKVADRVVEQVRNSEWQVNNEFAASANSPTPGLDASALVWLWCGDWSSCTTAASLRPFQRRGHL